VAWVTRVLIVCIRRVLAAGTVQLTICAVIIVRSLSLECNQGLRSAAVPHAHARVFTSLSGRNNITGKQWVQAHARDMIVMRSVKPLLPLHNVMYNSDSTGAVQ
jgi:hypothetical protein